MNRDGIIQMILLYLSFIDNVEDQRRFEQIYLTYKNRMYGVARSILRRDADAEDVVHTVFLAIAEKQLAFVLGLDSEKRLSNYLLTATRNTALNHSRKPDNTNIPIDIEDSSINTLPNLAFDDFLDTLCKQATYQEIIDAIESLSSIYRHPLYHHLVCEKSISETALILKQSVPATKQQLIRGKKLLLSKLKRRQIL